MWHRSSVAVTVLAMVAAVLAVTHPPATGATATRATLSVSSQTITVGERVRATVRVRPAAVRRVRLQRKTDGGWRALATKTTTRRGRAVFRLRPTRTLTIRGVVLRKGAQPRLVTPTRRVTVAELDDLGFDDPRPLDVNYAVDADRTTTKTISAADGGRLSVTGADGTGYLLKLPAGALRSDLDVTLTPVSSVDEEAVGQLLAAVEIEPHGLVLARPATLTVTPPPGRGLVGRQAFLMDEGGRDFHAYPGPSGTAGSLMLRLWHFSTPGLGLPPAGAPYFAYGRMPERVRARLEQLLVATEGEIGPCRLIKTTFDRHVNGRLVVSARTEITSDAKLAAAQSVYRDAIAWAHDWMNHCPNTGSSDLPLDPAWVDKLDPEFMELVGRTIGRIADYLLRRCYERHRIGDATTLLALAAQLVELMPHGDTTAWLRDKARGCARFELRFSARTEWANGFGEEAVIEAGFAAPLDIAEDGEPTGEAPVDHTEFFYTYPDQGGYGVGTRPGSATVELQLDLNAYEPADPVGLDPAPREQRVAFVIGGPVGGDTCGPRTPEEHIEWEWGGGFVPLWLTIVGDALPTDERTRFTPGDAGCSLAAEAAFGSDEQAGASLMRREWLVNCPDGCSDIEIISAQLDLVHTPVG